MIDAYLALGSNLGDRLSALSTAVELLAREPAFLLRRVSRAWETEPLGPPQPRYLNAVAQVGTLLSARATLQKLLAIEEGMGRVRRERWAARDIDLDLLSFGGRLVSEKGLTVPHPRLHERAFVLAPLRELAPLWVHPVSGKSVEELWGELPEALRLGVRPLRPIPRNFDEPGDEDGRA